MNVPQSKAEILENLSAFADREPATRNRRRPGVHRFHLRLHRRTQGRSLPPRPDHSFSAMAEGRVSTERRRPFRDAFRPSLQPFASRCFHGFIPRRNSVYSESIRSLFSRTFSSMARSTAISVLHLTPALGQLLLTSGDACLPSVRRVFFGGDVLTTDMVAAFGGSRQRDYRQLLRRAKPSARSAILKSRTTRQPIRSKLSIPFH